MAAGGEAGTEMVLSDKALESLYASGAATVNVGRLPGGGICIRCYTTVAQEIEGDAVLCGVVDDRARVYA